MSTLRPREIYFRLLRSVGAKNNGSVSSDARKKVSEKILPQGVRFGGYPSGSRKRFPPVGAFVVSVVLVYASRLSTGIRSFMGFSGHSSGLLTQTNAPMSAEADRYVSPTGTNAKHPRYVSATSKFERYIIVITICIYSAFCARGRYIFACFEA